MLALKRENESKTKFKLLKEGSKLQYPLLEDENLQKKITLKKEFQLKYDGKIEDVIKKSEEVCVFNDNKFELSPHQEFVKRFMHHETPYNGLLLYHGLGSGKTCSAIGITEQYRESFQEHSDYKKIIIIASPNVQENFKKQLFDSSKLKMENKKWVLNGCVGRALLNEFNDQKIDELSKEELTQKLNTLINNNYSFMGYEKFANKIMKLMNVKDSNERRRESMIKQNLYSEFRNRMIVIDEAHNIRLVGDTTKVYKKVATTLLKLFNYVQHIKLVLLSGTPMYNDPREIIFLTNILNMNDRRPIILNRQIFDKDGNLKPNGETTLRERLNGYVSYVRGENPYSFPYKIFPEDTKSMKQFSIKEFEYPTIQFNKKKIEEPLKYIDVFMTGISDIQRMAYNDVVNIVSKHDDEELDETLSQPDIEGEEKEQDVSKETTHKHVYSSIMDMLSLLNICYPNYDKTKQKGYIYGKPGFKHIMKYKEIKTRDKERNIMPKKYDFEYQSYVEERIFERGNIEKYSEKINAILQHIEHSDGIVLIYSQFIDSGLIPIALALEEMGFKRANNNNLLKSPSVDMYNVSKEHGKFKQGKYALITGNKSYSQNSEYEIRMATNSNNSYGEEVKVVLISQAGSEGLDFKNLRQVHILEPWYNMNRIEQIIGRAVRNCSHKSLPLKERNVQIFMYGTMDEERPENECIDLYVYRYAENKSKKIGKVLRILKESSVDCLLNYEQQNFTQENMNQVLDQSLSNGEEIKINVGDKSFTSQCDYMDNCNYKCNNIIEKKAKLDKTSLTTVFLQNENVIYDIKKLFMKKHIYKVNKLLRYILKNNKNSQKEEVYHTLNVMTSDENEVILDKYMRKGKLRNIDDYYYFQPIEYGISQTTINEKRKPIEHKIKVLLSTQDYQENRPVENRMNNAEEKLEIITELNKMFESAKKLLDKNEMKGETDFYKLFNYSLQVSRVILNKSGINLSLDDTESINMIITQHICETMDVKTLLVVLYYILQNKDSRNLSVLEQNIYDYFKEYLIEDKKLNKIFLVLLYFREKIKKVPIQIYEYVSNNSKAILEPAKQEEYRRHSGKIKELVNINIVNENLFYGYMDLHEKSDSVILKVRGPLKGNKSSGFFVEQKTKKDLIILINKLLNNDYSEYIKEHKINQSQLVVIIEIIFRYLEITNHNGLRYFLSIYESLLTIENK